MVKRVTGIGGVFYKCKGVQALKHWYAKYLGIASNQYGAMFAWCDAGNKAHEGTTYWSPFKQGTSYFSPYDKPYMFKHLVENIETLLAELKKERAEQVGEMEVVEYGKFARAMDCDGNKIELLEPIDKPILDEYKNSTK